MAGLVKGASRGEGLGNRFLAQVREADAAVHVLRCFESGRVTHVTGAVDPVDDAETVNTELMLADLATNRARPGLRPPPRQVRPSRPEKARGRTRGPPRTPWGAPLGARTSRPGGEGVPPSWRAGRPPSQLLTRMPTLYALNVAEEHIANGRPRGQSAEQYAAQARHNRRSRHRPARIGARRDAAGRAAGPAPRTRPPARNPPALHAGAARTLLNLNTFFTAGPSEARAWLLPQGATAHHAAGRVHTDFQQRFVRAEVTPWRAFTRTPQARPDLKGRDYEVRDGDVLRFRAG